MSSSPPLRMFVKLIIEKASRTALTKKIESSLKKGKRLADLKSFSRVTPK